MVKRTQLNGESELHGIFKPGDFLDCYSVAISPPDRPLEEIAQYILIAMPGWARTLLRIRDRIVSFFGIKTTRELPQNNSFRKSVAVGDHIGFMTVRSLSVREIILGEDDSHLDFRIALRREVGEAGVVSLATLVHRHNLIGRLYLMLIMPFHILIVKSRLAAAARHFSSMA
ncbi:DUF2867 domain-containing protein [Sneathiella sp.]|uniref:DUF2867 domain-containing protein n=1 Tax=Sneathiella sp. TaxID=1964365 RepID=UPI002607D041|nr:DUF2867 domain-containing protein [Sneathiella sp.]MDF2367640.1 DUF2867 domain-containing protein [Sneathiella sp.]